MNTLALNAYEINLTGMQVKNEDSNGWKAIRDVNTRNGYHVEYVNDDGRVWFVAVHISHFLFIESQLRIARLVADDRAPVMADDVSMGVMV